MAELVVLPNSPLIGRSATDIGLRTRFRINLLAISREGQQSTSRLRTMAIRTSDVLLMQGEMTTLASFSSDFGCVPLAEWELHLPNQRNALIAAHRRRHAGACRLAELGKARRRGAGKDVKSGGV